jgi:ABC-type multidrug transport system ATPase subunit
VCDRVVILHRGEVVTAGRPQELARPRGVEVDVDGGTRHYDDVTRQDVPRIVAELVGAGESVYGVRVLTSTLEEIYLEAVEGEQS